MSKFTVHYRTFEIDLRQNLTVEAKDHAEAIKKVEVHIRKAGNTPKSIGTAEEHR